ncbi:RING-H2 finger protein ATL63 [Phalaenopsis equestris]|uniref:RING-H2 finger protein ATL63 n=1 Tax=Phalaenopsis equestris TaxID=78828 RepID=UPI0009E385BF|nr:RING-H2 finger protein ATL63 [Phalaenopsis equestris]
MQDPYNGKVLLAAVICLSIVVLFVILLHIYGRWLLHRSRVTTTTNSTVLTEFHRRRRSSVDETGAVLSLRDVVGRDSAAVAALPLFVYSEKGQDGRVVDCVVCLSKMEEGEKGRILPRCGHGFHVCCIDMWLRDNSCCPICRTPAAAVVREDREEEEGGCEVVVMEADEGVEEVSDMVVVVEMDDDDQKKEGSSSSSSSSSSSTTTTVISGSLKRMLSRSRSDKRVFPSVIDN